MKKAKWRGDRARALREKRELSTTQVAGDVGVTARTIDNWEKGTSRPDAEQAGALCRLFGCSINYLLDLQSEARASA